MNRTLEFKCEKCDHSFEKKFKSNQIVKERYKCPECKTLKSCYRVWNVSTIIPDYMKATPNFKAAAQTKERFKKYKGQNGKKRLYKGGGLNK